MNNDNIELHLYLWLDRKWKYKSDTKMSTSQREQYRGTVHLFIGTGHNQCKITSKPFTFANDFKEVHRGLNNLFPFKPVPFFAVMPKLPCA
jgi:viroplasmin and RNaseH domain-containing protein